MKKYSIIFTINIVFLISFLLISISFALFYNFDEQKQKHIKYKRDMQISKIFMHHYMMNGLSSELIEHINSLDFTVVTDTKKIKEILASKDIKIREMGSKRFFNLSHLKSKESSYVHIQTPKEEIILSSNDTLLSNNKSVIFGIYLAILSIFALLYLSIINKLKPLKLLKQSAKNFGDEKFDLECLNSNHDEISQLANEFYEAAKKLKKVKESRNVFIRNIMHELKTPIAKGKFLTQLPQTEKNVDSMQKVFYRLESLINEFASIEELISTKKELEKKEYFLEDVIDSSIDILMCDEDEVLREFENIKINIDFNLFSIALKNLLDNGIKYSKDKKVKIKSKKNEIIFENRALPLESPINSYFEPFFRGDSTKTNHSFGLGLYIVKHILDAHGFTLKYEHVDGANIFIIKLTN